MDFKYILLHLNKNQGIFGIEERRDGLVRAWKCKTKTYNDKNRKKQREKNVDIPSLLILVKSTVETQTCRIGLFSGIQILDIENKRGLREEFAEKKKAFYGCLA